MNGTLATYTIKHCGCYVDECRGVYAIDAIYSFAKSHGFKTVMPIQYHDVAHKKSLSEYEFSNEIEDEIDTYMNEKFPVEGATWGRSEQGDWGLWENDDQS